jgi:hypothetical protein
MLNMFVVFRSSRWVYLWWTYDTLTIVRLSDRHVEYVCGDQIVTLSIFVVVLWHINYCEVIRSSCWMRLWWSERHVKYNGGGLISTLLFSVGNRCGKYVYGGKTTTLLLCVDQIVALSMLWRTPSWSLRCQRSEDRVAEVRWPGISSSIVPPHQSERSLWQTVGLAVLLAWVNTPQQAKPLDYTWL